ncbi:MAG: hypothetical protein ACRDKS_16935 [Actinomycetota bacterium]
MPRVRVPRMLLLVALVVAGAVPAPATAFHGSTLPLLSSDPLADEGAVSYRFTAPQSTDVEVEMELSFDGATMEGDGFWLYDGSGQLVFAFISTGIIGGDPEVHIELPDPIGVVQDIRTEPGGFGTGTLIGFALDAGTYVALAGAVSDGTLIDGTISLYAEQGSALVNKVVSTGGFAHREADFRGTNVVVGAPAGLPIFIPGPVFIGTSIRPVVMADASLDEDVARSLYGWFGSFNLVQQMTVEGPGGTSAGPDHIFDGAPAGEYTFTVDLAAGVPEGALWLWGLDAALA